VKTGRLLYGLFLFVGACHGPAPREPAAERPDALEPEWQDALPPAPKLLVFLRPKGLRDDKVYGPMLRRALELAREQRVTSGALVLDAIEDAEEVIAELGDLTPRETSVPADSLELLLVLRGTRSDIDPSRLVGPEGELLWSDGPNGVVRELVHERDRDGTPNPTSLFELPNRTWVVASGAARDRARDAFAHPTRHPEPPFALDSLATIVIDGPALVGRVSLLQGTGPLGGVGRMVCAPSPSTFSHLRVPLRSQHQAGDFGKEGEIVKARSSPSSATTSSSTSAARAKASSP
jgi:hypothetical protein